MQSIRTTQVSAHTAHTAPRTRPQRTRRINNAGIAGMSGGYAAALKPPSAELSSTEAQQQPNKRPRIDAPNAGQPAAPEAASAPPPPAPSKLDTIAQAILELQHEQDANLLRECEVKSKLTNAEVELQQVKAKMHAIKTERDTIKTERDKVLTENRKLRATLKEMMDKEASKKELTDKLKINMRQTAECMVALGYATQPVPEASAELVYSPGAALSMQSTPASQASEHQEQQEQQEHQEHAAAGSGEK